MPSATRITLPPSRRPVGGLLSAASPVPTENWTRGVTFASGQCLTPFAIGPCADGAVTKEVGNLSDIAVFEAFNVYQAVQCSTMGGTAVTDFANQSLDVTREYGVASELLTGAATGNPSLADADIIGSAADPVAALGCLEESAARALSGRLAYLHVSAQVATELLSKYAMWRDGNIWRTASGNVVVVSAGYDGREPGTDAPGPGDHLYMYATGEVYAAYGQRDVLDYTNRGDNVRTAYAEDAALVVFDPCFNVAIDSGFTACATPTS